MLTTQFQEPITKYPPSQQLNVSLTPAQFATANAYSWSREDGPKLQVTTWITTEQFMERVVLLEILL